METDFGAVQGNFNTLNALATLAHDVEGVQMFQIEFLAALRLVDHKIIDFIQLVHGLAKLGRCTCFPVISLFLGKTVMEIQI